MPTTPKVQTPRTHLKPRKMFAWPNHFSPGNSMVYLDKVKQQGTSPTHQMVPVLVIPLTAECVDVLVKKAAVSFRFSHIEAVFAPEEAVMNALASIGLKAPKSAAKKGAKRT